LSFSENAPSTYSSSQVYGGEPTCVRENEIIRMITNGTAKNSSSHRYGAAITPPRVPGSQRFQPAAFMR